MNQFNPIKEDKEGVMAKRTIWSSKSIDVALKGLEQGRKLIANPFYENNTKILKGDLVFERTNEEIEEWKKCANNIIYFVEKYCKLMTPTGIQKIVLRDYQEAYLKHLEKNRLSIMLSARQAGKTTTSALFMLHYICFNFDKNALVLGNKRKTAVEILDKAKKIFVELPYFLRPGVYKWNEAEIVLDNGCRLMAEATTINSGISFTFHCVLADEFGHIAPNILDKFYENLFPTITAAKARFMITSTQNGYNLFYRIYKAAEAGENEYAPFKVDWWQIPEWNPEKKCWEPRTEAWHRLQVANYGSEEAFNRQFGTDFDVDVNTLVNKKVLKKTQENTIEFINKDLPGVSLSDNYYWKPDYDPQSQLRRDYIIICGDLAEGVERDYTHFNICRFVEPESGKIECVGYYRSNDVDRRDIAKSIMELSAIQCNMDHLLLSFERNTYGELFLKHIEEFDEKGVVPGFDNGVLVKYFNESGTKYEYGAKISRGNKNNMCLLFKEDYEKNNIINQSTVFCSELLNFSDPEDKGVWKAAFGHDDAVMSMVQLEYVKQTLQYILLKQEFDSQKPETESTVYNPYLDMYSWLPSQQFDSIYSFGDNQTSINSNRLR